MPFTGISNTNAVGRIILTSAANHLAGQSSQFSLMTCSAAMTTGIRSQGSGLSAPVSCTKLIFIAKTGKRGYPASRPAVSL